MLELIEFFLNLIGLWDLLESFREYVNLFQQKVQHLKSDEGFHNTFLSIIILLLLIIAHLLYKKYQIKKQRVHVSYVRKISVQYYEEYKKVLTQQALRNLQNSKEYKEFMLRANQVPQEEAPVEDEIHMSDEDENQS
jgi:hypothetical protein